MDSQDKIQKPSNHILVVDDYRVNRIKLAGLLKKLGYMVTLSENGLEALDLVKKYSFDLILLDIIMPKMDGYEVLKILKNDKELRNIPVIIISGIDEIESIVRCIKMGAEDYMPKPFNSMLLKARLNACLEKKRWRDQEQIYLQQLEVEREKSERLLLNILPKAIADRLKREETIIADSFEEITVLFADIDNFTRFSAQMLPEKVVELLNKIFSYFDRLALRYELEKIKTIGDAYMVVGGLNAPKINSATAIAEMALDMRKGVLQFKWENGKPLSMRIGIHTGPVVAGVIGKSKFSYDLWGDTVNIASRMESQGISGCIQVSERTYQYLKDKFLITPRGTIQIKGKGKIQTYLLEGKKQA